MLIAIAGSQGSGKTTVLERIKERGYPIVTRKTSRSILDEWGVTLSQVNNDRELTVRFQDKILERKFKDEKVGFEDLETVWFTERTFADLFTYALIAIGKDNEYSEWLNNYYDRCVTAQKIYDYVCYLEGGLFDVVHDGVRGTNTHYAAMVDTIMKNYTEEMAIEDGMSIIDEMNPLLRVATILEIANEIQYD